jgi:hypothetical protein
MLGLSDTQLGTILDMARSLPVEKRDLYLRRIAAMLAQRGRGHFNDADVSDVGEAGAHWFGGAAAGGLRENCERA